MKYFQIDKARTATQLLVSACFLTAGAPLALAQDSEEEAGLMEEITVTARKMSENIQDVPVAITAITSDLIENLNIRGLDDISKVTAGLTFESELGRDSNRPVIRGQANILGSSGVSYFIDGVYIAGSIDDYDINDVERIEVVKGPQSALYGRNTYSGAINIITKAPTDEMGGRFMARLTDDDEYEVSAALRGRMTENLSGSIAARTYSLDGLTTNAFDNTDIGKRETNSVSGSLFYQGGSWDVRFRTYMSRSEDGQPAIFATSTDDNNCYFDDSFTYGGRGRYYCGVINPQPVNSDWRVGVPDARQTVDTWQSSLAINADINDTWSFTSITGYNERDTTFITDGDYSPTSFQTANFATFPFVAGDPPWTYGYVNSTIDFTFASASEAKDWSQEFRFAFESGAFSGLIGGYYFDGSDTGRDVRELPPGAQDIADANAFAEFLRMQSEVCGPNPFCSLAVPLSGSTIVVPRNVNAQDITNTALFGLLAWRINDSWRITGEARWAEEKVSQVVTTQNLGEPISDITSTSATFDSFSPRLTVDWSVSDNSMLYLLYAEGTKPGGFNGAVAIGAGIPTYDEEEVDSIEFGSKNTFANGQFMVNLAAYYNEVTGYQMTQNVQSGTNTTSATVNAGDADIKGIELETMWRPQALDGLTLTFNYAWNDTEFSRGVDANQGVLEDVADDGLANCSTGDQFPDVSGCTSKYGSIVGHEIPRSPEHQAFLDVDFRRPFGSGSWEWFVGGNYFYESSKWSQVHNLAETGSATLVSARIGFNNENWLFQAYGKNLTGEDSVPAVLRYAEPTAYTRNFAAQHRRDTYWGLQASYQF